MGSLISKQSPRVVLQVNITTGQSKSIYEAPPFEGVEKDNGRINIPSFDGLEIPVLFRRAKFVSGMDPALFVRIMGGIGLDTAAPWDEKTEYLYQRGISVMKVYVRGKARFGRKLLDALGGPSGRVKDILAVLNYAVQNLKVPADRILLFGHSDGAVLAAKAAAAGAPIGNLVISSMVKDPEPTPPIKNQCVVAFQGEKDSLPPEKARAELERVLGPNTTHEPCGRFQVMEGEAHELERAESWAEIYAAIVTGLNR